MGVVQSWRTMGDMLLRGIRLSFLNAKIAE